MKGRQQTAVEVRVEGEVQRVGFRRFVERVAKGLKLSGYVENKTDGTAFIFAQGGKEGVDRFLTAVMAAPAPIAVEKMTTKGARVHPSLKTFHMRLGSTALELQEGFGGMETQFADYRADFADYRAEFKDYRADFADYRAEFKDYRAEFKDYKGEFRGFAARTDQNFRTLADKYGEISTKLTGVLETLQKESAETREELKRSVDNLSKLVDAYIAQSGQRRTQP